MERNRHVWGVMDDPIPAHRLFKKGSNFDHASTKLTSFIALNIDEEAMTSFNMYQKGTERPFLGDRYDPAAMTHEVKDINASISKWQGKGYVEVTDEAQWPEFVEKVELATPAPKADAKIAV